VPFATYAIFYIEVCYAQHVGNRCVSMARGTDCKPGRKVRAIVWVMGML